MKKKIGDLTASEVDKLKQTVTEVWNAVFNEKIQTTQYPDSLKFQSYFLTRKEIEVTRKSILGKETKIVIGYTLTVCVPSNYSPWEPTDTETIELAQSEHITEITAALIQAEAKNRTDLAMEKYYAN